MNKADRAFQEFLASLGPMVPDETIARLAECAERYDLDFHSLYDWANSAFIAQGLLENMVDGTLDIVAFEDGEPKFKMSDNGKAKAEEILGRSDQGRQYLEEVKIARAEDDAVLGAEIIDDASSGER